ncbi:HTH-type transcriptional regulator GltR [Pullulanibacillus camelliae]|uniref:HTH-type transcriptional regulator GltR n=1 Tax=Pullulanibacillus camelliae TaxID=1707096 RepID=A0A8J2YN91_9BACL|nr:LysR family transcriptional regulator [Pullulanibacillus camelliae]GGE56211.1 HTH-type transcriptional regulator GltR [Pullulanibacillus camelliae]
MDLKDISIFAKVAKTGSVTKTAKALGYVQSNITTRIQHLENEFNTSLFDRQSRGMVLTTNGEILLQYVEQILNLWDEAEHILRDTETPNGTLKIGAMETTAATRLPSVLMTYHQHYPNVDISLVSGPTKYLIDSVLNHELEAAFVAGPIEHPLLEKSSVIKEELVIVSQTESVNMAPSDSLTILGFREGCSYRKRFEQYLDHLGIQSRKMIELGTLEGILGCVTAGLGISLLPKKVVERGKYPVYVRKIPDEYSLVPTVLIRRKDAFLSPALSRFIEAIDKAVES